MPNLSWVPRINITKTISVTPTISTSIYASGDQIGGIMTLTDAIRQEANTAQGNCEIVSVTILDKDKQNVAMDIWFFNTSPTLISTDNAVFDMTDANQFAQCIGYCAVGATYSSGNSNSVSSTVSINLPLQVASTQSSPTNIYAVAIVRGTPTYTTTSSLQFQFGLFVD